MRRGIIALLSVFLLVVSSVLMVKVEQLKPSFEEEETIPVYNYNSLVFLFPALKEALADFFYMKTCLLTGTGGFEKKERKKEFSSEDWKRLVENLYTIHRLDPYYFDPYYLEAAFISWMVKGNSELIERVNQNLKYGLEFCKDWRIPFFLGFNYFYFLGNKENGAKYLEIASQMKGAPSYLKLLTSRLYAESGRIDFAIAVIKEELKNTQNENLKGKLEKRLKALESMKLLYQAIAVFKSKFGRCPDNLEELIAKRILKKIPEDPFGGKFYLRKDCSVWTTSNLRSKK